MAYASTIDPVKHIQMGIVVIGLIVTMVTIVAIAGLFFDALQMVKFKIYIGILSVVIVLGALFYYILGLYSQIQETIKAVT